MKAKLLLLLLCFSSLCVMGQVPVSCDKCNDCGKAISQCQYKGKHPKCPVCGKIKEKCQYKFDHPKCNDCGKLLQNCPYKGKHPKCSDCGRLMDKCPYKGKHPKCSDCGKLIDKCAYNGKHPRCSECGELLNKCKYGGKHPAPTPTEYSVKFYCNAHVATVFVDGKDMGSINSPKSLKVGSHSIRITADGYEPYTGVLDVNAKNTTMTVSLTRIPPTPTTGTLRVSTTPLGATLLVDGKSVGTTPCEVPGLKEGQHSIRITLSDYSDEQRNVTITAGETSTQTIILQKIEQTPTPEVVKPVSDLTPVSKSERTSYFHKNNIYVSPELQFGSYNSVGGSVGAYIANFNIEGFYHYGLSECEEVCWIPNPSLNLGYSVAWWQFGSSTFGGKLGYGIILGSCLSFTPQAGLSIVSTSVYYSGYATSLCFGCKLDYAFAKHFGVSIAPEYAFRISESDTYSQLINASGDFDKWSSGFRCRIGVSLFF